MQVRCAPAHEVVRFAPRRRGPPAAPGQHGRPQPLLTSSRPAGPTAPRGPPRTASAPEWPRTSCPSMPARQRESCRPPCRRCCSCSMIPPLVF